VPCSTRLWHPFYNQQQLEGGGGSGSLHDRGGEDSGLAAAFERAMEQLVSEIGERGRHGAGGGATTVAEEGVPPGGALLPSTLSATTATASQHQPAAAVASPGGGGGGSFVEISSFFREERAHMEATLAAHSQRLRAELTPVPARVMVSAADLTALQVIGRPQPSLP
jgi:hypothetical protein